MCIISRGFQLLDLEILFGEDLLSKLLGVVKWSCMLMSCPEPLLRVCKAEDVSGHYRWRTANNKMSEIVFCKIQFPNIFYVMYLI